MLRQEYMSDEEYSKECSKVTVYNINKPMDWMSYRKLPSDLKKKYLEKLSSFNVNSHHIASMFNVSPSLVRKQFFVHKVPGTRGTAKQEDVDAFYEWVNQDEAGQQRICSRSISKDTTEVTITVKPGQKINLIISGGNE